MSLVASKKPCQRVLRLKDAAVYAGTSTRTLRGMIHRGELRFVQYGENAPWLIYISDLDELMNRNTLQYATH